MTTAVEERPPVQSNQAPQAPAAQDGHAAPATMYSLESERLLLSVAMNEGRKPLVGQLFSLLSHADFFQESHAVIWACMRTLGDQNQPHDAVSVLDYTRSHNLPIGGVEYVAQLNDDITAATASEEAVLAAAKRVKAYAVRRRVAAICRQGLALCEQGGVEVEQLIGQLEDDLVNQRKLAQTSRSGPEHIQPILQKVLDTMQKQMDGEVTPVISTGFEELDRLLYGLADEDYILLAARPSMGKTAAAMNLTDNIGTSTQHEYGVLLFSTEMKNEALGRRALSRASHVNLESLRRGSLTNDDFSRITEGLGKLEHGRIWIDDEPGLSMHEIRSRARAHVAAHGKCVIVIDYLQNVAAPEGAERKDHVSSVSRACKQLARELKCPVIGLCQLSRSLEQRANKRPLMSDLRESGSLEQDADVIIFLYRDEYYNPDTKEPGIAEWIVAKQRDGAVGTVKLLFDAPRGHFCSL